MSYAWSTASLIYFGFLRFLGRAVKDCHTNIGSNSAETLTLLVASSLESYHFNNLAGEFVFLIETKYFFQRHLSLRELFPWWHVQYGRLVA